MGALYEALHIFLCTELTQATFITMVTSGIVILPVKCDVSSTIPWSNCSRHSGTVMLCIFPNSLFVELTVMTNILLDIPGNDVLTQK